MQKVLRKQFLKPDTIDMIPAGGYSGNVNESKKALMWLVYGEQTYECRIMHGRNGREYRLPQVPHLSIDGLCEETKTLYKFWSCYWHGHTCPAFGDVNNMPGDTLAQRHERTIARLEKITWAGYQEVQWESEFDERILGNHPELKTHPIIQHSPLNTRYTLCRGRKEDMCLHYKIQQGESYSM
jgi:G:T-mismatch repair DNA endonuclease (very short patch repair protein)